jgi:hypothetical protein
MMQKRNKQLLNQGKTLNKELRGYASLDDCGRHTIVAAPYIKKVYSHPKEEGKCYHIPYYTLYSLSLQDSHKSRFPGPGIGWLAILFSEILEPWPWVDQWLLQFDTNCSNICTRIWQRSSQVSFQNCKQRNKGMM